MADLHLWQIEATGKDPERRMYAKRLVEYVAAPDIAAAIKAVSDEFPNETWWIVSATHRGKVTKIVN